MSRCLAQPGPLESSGELAMPPAFGASCALALFAVLLLRSASALEIQLPPEVNAFKQDQDAEIANAQCLICHSVEYVTTQPPSPRAFWKSSVQKMQQKYGAAIPDEQVERLLDYLVRNYGATNGAGPAPVASPAPAAAPAPSPGQAPADGPAIATKYGCFGCHNVTLKIVGPAYKEVAAKYRADASAAAQLEQQIQKGGSGKWGPIIMPPFPQVSAAETKVLTAWILGMK